MLGRNRGGFKVTLESLLVILLLTLPLLAGAQETSPSQGQANPPASDSSKKSETDETQPPSGASASWSNTYFHRIGAAGLLAGSPEGLRFGRLYVPTADVRGIVERLDGSNGQPNDVQTRTLFQAIVIYDRQFRRNRFALQYRPRLALADGKVVKDFSNQNATLDMIVYSRPRWSVRIGDAFQYSYTQQSLDDLFFDVDSVTSTTVTSSFVDGPNRWLSNATYVSLSYALSQRSSITLAPRYSYMESGTGKYFNSGQLYGGDVSWNYRTSTRQAIGVQYTSQVIHRRTNGGTDTIYQTTAGTLERQVALNWRIKGSVGLTTASFGPNSRQWYTYGTFGLVKLFARSSLALNFTRGDSFSNGFISDQYSDRVDLAYQTQLTRRMKCVVGGGYLREIISGGFQAKYARAEADFLIAPRAGLYSVFGYARKNQGGNTAGLFIGNRDLFTFGIRWQPARRGSLGR